jgi:uncharacterized protein YecT (DUF1311 family)
MIIFSRPVPLLFSALLGVSLITACDGAEKKETTPVVQDTMLLHDLAQANRNTAATDMDTTIPVVVRSRTEDESDGLVAVAGGPRSADQILTPSGTQPRPATGEPRIPPPRRARDAPAPSQVPSTDVNPASGDPCDSPAMDDQRSCLNRYIARNDANLNRVYGELISQARQSGGAELEERFRVQQRAWIIERDEGCRASRSEEGPLWARVRARCLGNYSDRRTLELQAALNRLRGLGN